MKSVYDKIKWDRVGQINHTDGDVCWYYICNKPKPYSKTKGLGLDAGKWKCIAMWHVKHKSLWQIIKSKIKIIINDN